MSPEQKELYDLLKEVAKAVRSMQAYAGDARARGDIVAILARGAIDDLNEVITLAEKLPAPETK